MDNKSLGSYYKKSAFALKLLRYAVILIFIIFLISCTLIYRNDITVENIQFLAKYITLGGGSSRYYDSEFSINAYDDSEIFMLRDNVAIVGNTGIALHELSGNKLFNYTYSYSTPAFVSDDHNILVYDIDGNELSIFNSFSRVYSQKYPYSVKCADINEKGFAVITSDRGYRSALIIYNSSFDEIYRWLSEENYLSALSLSPNGRNAAVATVRSDGGAYKCGIRVLNTSKEEPEYISEEFDELPVFLRYSQNGRQLYAITDSAIHFYNSDLTEITQHKFNQSKINNFYTYEDLVFITESNNLSGNSVTLTGFDTSGNEVVSINISDEVHDVAIVNDKIYTLGNDCVYRYTFGEQNKGSSDGYVMLTEQYNSILCDSDENCYFASNSSVVKAEFNETEEKKQ